MKTSAEIEAEFRKDFQALLNKYKAEVDMKVYWDYDSYYSVECTVYVGAMYNDNSGKVSKPYEFELGSYHSYGT